MIEQHGKVHYITAENQKQEFDGYYNLKQRIISSFAKEKGWYVINITSQLSDNTIKRKLVNAFKMLDKQKSNQIEN